MYPNSETNEFEVATLHPGITREQVRDNTGWPIRFRTVVEETPRPNEGELATLRDLMRANLSALRKANGCG